MENFTFKNKQVVAFSKDMRKQRVPKFSSVEKVRDITMADP